MAGKTRGKKSDLVGKCGVVLLELKAGVKVKDKHV
jgi:hypothetical protein